MELSLVKDNDPVLRQPAIDFDFNGDIDPVELSKEMAILMFENGGIGLAAPQVGINRRMFLLGDNSREEAIACFNPKIKQLSVESVVDYEGCLSFPGLFLRVDRQAQVEVEFTDVNGEQKEMGFVDILARVFQHELDHLNGKLYTDYQSRLTLQLAQKRQKKLLKKLHRKAKNRGRQN